MGFSYNIQYALIELLMFYGLGRNALVLDGYASQKIESVLNLGIHQFLQIYLDLFLILALKELFLIFDYGFHLSFLMAYL